MEEVQKRDVRKLSLTELEEFFLANGDKKFRAKQVYEWLWNKSLKNFDDMSNISLSTRELLKTHFVINHIQVDLMQHSTDGTIKNAVKLFDANQSVVTAPVWKGKDAVVKLGAVRPLVVAVPAGSAAQLKTQVVRPDPLVAPLTKGQTLGSLKVMQGDMALFEVPLMVLESVEQAGVLGRAWDAVRLWIK
jgi:hypothetical protein